MNRALPLLATGAAIVIVLLALVGQGRFILAIGFIGAIIFLLLFRRMDVWWMVAVVSVGSNLHLMQSRATIHLLSSIAVVGLGVMGFVMSQGRSASIPSTPRRAIKFLLLIMILTAFVRGWGLRVLGSANWGGMSYVVLITAGLLFTFSAQIRLSEERMWKTVKWACLFGLVPAFALAVVIVVPVSEFVLQYFVQVRAIEDVAEVGIAGGQRLQVLQLPARWLAFLALLYFDRKHSLSPFILILGAISFTLIGLSGHRASVVLIGLTAFVYLLLRRRSIGLTQYGIVLFCSAFALIALYGFISYLPITFQRAVAFLPGIGVEYEAALSAEGTTEWRIEMWRMMLPMIPDYLLIGRGLGFDLMEAYSAYTLATDRAWHLFRIATHDYHSGPLWFLVDLGIPGLLAGIVFMFGGSVYYVRQIPRVPEGSRWKSVYVVFVSIFIAYSVFFFTVNGGTQILSVMLLIASVLEVILASVKHIQPVPPPASAPAVVTPAITAMRPMLIR